MNPTILQLFYTISYLGSSQSILGLHGGYDIIRVPARETKSKAMRSFACRLHYYLGNQILDFIRNGVLSISKI